MQSPVFIRRVQMIFIILCFSILVASMSGLFFPTRWSNQEFRSLAPIPKWHDQKGIHAYVQDHVGLRQLFVSIANLYSLIFFNTTQDARIIAGKKGWLYYNENPNIQNDVPLTPLQLEIWRTYMEGRATWFRRHGISFYFLIVPDKQTIYPEYLPSSYQKIFSRREQLKKYLEEHSFVRLLDTTDAVLQSKNNGTQLYYKYGTHWNSVGAFAAYRFLVGNLLEFIPEPIGEDRLEIQSVPSFDKGLLGMLRLLPLASFDRSPKYLLKRRQSSIISIGPRTRPASGDWSVYAIGNPLLPRALVYGDSFFGDMMPFFSEHFEKVKYVNNGDFTMQRADIESLKPDVVLEQFVERKLKYAQPPLDPWMQEDNKRFNR